VKKKMQMINLNLQVNSMKASAVQGLNLQGLPLQKTDLPGSGFQALLMETMKGSPRGNDQVLQTLEAEAQMVPMELLSEETEISQELIPPGEVLRTEEPSELPMMAGIWINSPAIQPEEGMPQMPLTTINSATAIPDQRIPGMTETQQPLNPEVIGMVPGQTANLEGNQSATEETSSQPVMTIPESNMETRPIPEQKGSAKAWGHLENPAIGKASENSAIYEKSPELTEAIPQGIQQRMTSEVNPVVPEAVQQTEKPAPFVQVADKIAEAAAKGEPTALKMTLNPEQLGEIEIKIDMNQGKLQIGITAEKPETLNLLSGQLEKLTTRLGLQQFQIEGITLNPVIAPIQTNSNPSTNANLHQNLAGGLGWQLGQQMGEGRNNEPGKAGSQKASGRIRAAAMMDIPEISGIQANSIGPRSNRLDYTV
jgi:hypothetical protein